MSAGHHHGHTHGPAPDPDATPAERHSKERAVAVAAALTGAFMIAEVVGGLVSGSLTLLADAGHMLTDCASLLLAWFAFRIARRPSDTRRTYGFDRVSVLAAFVNGLALFVIAVWIAVEAWRRLDAPVEVLGGPMLWIAGAGLVVNLLSFRVLSGAGGDDLNVRAAVLHVLGDLLGSVAALIAALVIIFTGWMPIDPILSVVVALLILRSAWGVVRDSGHILLEAAPEGIDTAAVAADLKEHVPGLISATHIHAWSITEERPMVTLEATVDGSCDMQEVRRAVKQRLHDTFGVGHATVETNPDGPGPD